MSLLDDIHGLQKDQLLVQHSHALGRACLLLGKFARQEPCILIEGELGSNMSTAQVVMEG